MVGLNTGTLDLTGVGTLNVFTKNGKRTYVAYNHGSSPKAVNFSDGTKVDAKPKSLTVQTANR